MFSDLGGVARIFIIFKVVGGELWRRYVGRVERVVVCCRDGRRADDYRFFLRFSLNAGLRYVRAFFSALLVYGGVFVFMRRKEEVVICFRGSFNVKKFIGI